MRQILAKSWQGWLLVSVLGVAAIYLSLMIPGTNEILLGIALGVFAGNLPFQWEGTKACVDWWRSTGLNISIIFLGFGISFRHIGALGWSVLAVLILLVLIMLVLTLVLARVFRCKTTTGWLVGFGTVICGSSAIAALSGSVTRDKEDAGIAIAVVNLMGLTAMLLLPFALQAIPVTEKLAALMIGGGLHAVGNVAGAAYAMNDAIGDYAITIKLGRVAMLAPSLILFNLMANRTLSLRENLRLPYYIWGFIIVITIVSFVPIPALVLSTMKAIAKIQLTLAMVGIGLGISVKGLFLKGRKAMGFGVVIFLIHMMMLISLVWLFMK